MPATVTWLGKAQDKVSRELLAQFARELKAAFPAAGAVTVCDCFGGYSRNQNRKVVLGVETRSRRAYESHVVKLGDNAVVSADFDGWNRCILNHHFASRIFVSVKRQALPNGRAAIVYQDAFRFFGDMQEAEGSESLEHVAFQAIHNGRPDVVSVERVIRQLYTELFRCFYRSPRQDLRGASRFYRRRLRRAMDRWRADPGRRELRRDLVWLLCSHETPDAPRPPAYLDAYDYVGWALREGRLPPTLTGRSHGDLHGRNVLVGVQRGEAEYPAVFDYGEMSNRNVLVWDFVKLECELKVRFLLALYEDAEACRCLLAMAIGDRAVPAAPIDPERPTASSDPRALRARRLAFAFRFEHVLASLTRRIHELADPGAMQPPGGRRITGNAHLDRALCLIMRIRQEAALCLGDGQPQRGGRGRWRDEYYFGLAAYGLSTAKFDYRETETGFACVSSGVAVAQIDDAVRVVCEQAAARASALPQVGSRRGHPYPSYRVPLAHARRLWKGRRSPAALARAIAILDAARRHYDYAVPVHQEYVLLLAETGRYRDALQLLEPMEDICAVFHDVETLSRIGRICKSLGDRALELDPVPVDRLVGHPAHQWYETALMRYRDAFALSDDRYPGINAATLCAILGRRADARRLARRVLRGSERADLGSMDAEGAYWLLATRGEACLLQARWDEAARAYGEALALLPADQGGLAQSVYSQLSRLRWALGAPVERVLSLFHASPFRLTKPLD